ncbi:uncharacterized protein LOC9644519 isoform X1 [Selaginella moellendorffii]|uniref:uncharacterized protein LOC9644519 isoform X1 n=1 Tax=Selaginella moellendorffii TaxID=88036 RepID=UPI000D1C9032|nr:uncharacterized protein LOC9644519 isoform X1 [Selaginella moellendorffii]|eukprot:XP_024544818.1 uncharacterized protein LOC9644519 isoform X1 [Selaginella moellendorffii]
MLLSIRSTRGSDISIDRRGMRASAMALLLALLGFLLVAGDGQMLYKDSRQSIEARIKDLLRRMTLEEKIGQMTQIERAVASQAVVRQYGIGSVLNGGGSAPAERAAPNVWEDMVDDYQIGAMSTRLGIPVIYGVDAVHGHNNVYGATIYPHNIGLGSSRYLLILSPSIFFLPFWYEKFLGLFLRDPELVRRIGAATALEVRATGMPYAFAPCIAVCRDPRWGRCYESYGEDTQLVRSMTKIIQGLQGSPPPSHPSGYPYVGGPSKVVACAKHFVGDGGTVKGIDENNTVTTYRQLVQVHMGPYLDAIAMGVSTIMISYSSFNGIKMHANRFLVTEVLKNRLGFQGFLISDWEAIDRITDPPKQNYTYSVLTSVNAGIDMIMVPFDYQNFINILTGLVKSGAVSQSRIDDAVTRILRVKFAAGLFEAPKANRKLNNKVGAEDHRELAREAVRKSLVLLKNSARSGSSKNILPLSKTAPKILVAGTHADDLGLQCGGWTITWQGGSGQTTIGTTIRQAIANTVSQSTQVVYEQSPDANFVKDKGFSYAVVVIGEQPYAEIAGDNLNLTIPSQGIDTIRNVCSSLRCAVVLISGRPLVLEPHIDMMDALVAAWLPGSEGQGVADVLFGDHDFVGKSSRTWFKRVDQLPMNVGDMGYDPLFPYGFGMTMRQQ